MADPTRTIEVKPLTLHIGAEIAGIDLSQPLPAGSRKAVSDALLKWKVVFFRGQQLDHAGHVALRARWVSRLSDTSSSAISRTSPRSTRSPSSARLRPIVPPARSDRGPDGTRTSPPR